MQKEETQVIDVSLVITAPCGQDTKTYTLKYNCRFKLMLGKGREKTRISQFPAYTYKYIKLTFVSCFPFIAPFPYMFLTHHSEKCQV